MMSTINVGPLVQYLHNKATKPGRNENSQTANIKQQISNMGLLLRYHIKYQDNFLMPKQDNVRLVVQTKPVVSSIKMMYFHPLPGTKCGSLSLARVQLAQVLPVQVLQTLYGH